MDQWTKSPVSYAGHRRFESDSGNHPRVAGVSHYQAKRIDHMRDQLADERSARQDQLREMATTHSLAMAHAESRRIDAVQEAEKERVNSLLVTQKSDVALAAARADGVASALAEKVETTKSAAAAAVESTSAGFNVRIKPLEDARYENAGRRGGQIDFGKVMQGVTVIGLMVGALLLSGHVKVTP